MAPLSEYVDVAHCSHYIVGMYKKQKYPVNRHVGVLKFIFLHEA
jgi:hypothetical protein